MRASTPIPCSVPCRIWKVEACTAGRTVTANDTVLQALRRKRAATLARDFLQQMHALGMTAAEVETLLRETETSEKE